MSEPAFQLFEIAEPVNPVVWATSWSSDELEEWFTQIDAELTRPGEAWWEVTGSDRWEPILEPLESALGTETNWNVFIHKRCSQAVQVIDVLTQFEGEVGNGGLFQWIGNRPQRSLAAVQALRMIGLDDWATDLHRFNSAIASLDIADLMDPADFESFATDYPIKRKLMGRYSVRDAEAIAANFESRVHGNGRKTWAVRLRAFAVRNADVLPRA